MSIRFGITCGGDFWLPEDIRAVEELGFDGFWTGEHIVYHRPISESTTLLTWAAALTERITVGPATYLLPLRHPTIVAKEFSTLDVLSGGRVIFSCGVGGDYPREFGACEIPVNERGRRCTESIEIMRKYWAGERFDYDGRIFKLRDVDMLPTPAQPGGPPIWVCGRQEGPMRRAARLADGWQPYMYSARRARDSFFQVKAFAAEAGRDLPDDFVFACFIYVSLSEDIAEARIRGVKELTYRYDQDFSELVEKYCAYGPPSRVVDYLAQYVEAGVNYFVLAPVMPPNRRRAHLEALASGVLPVLRTMEPAPIT